MRFATRLLVSTAALAAPALAHAQSAPIDAPAQGATTDGDVTVADLRIDPHDVVVTAARVEQPAREVGQAVTVIDRADIDRRQTVVLTDLLATTPGVTVSRNGGPGGLTALRIRGAEAEQTLVVIDGVRVNDPSSPGGAFDFASLLSANVDRVEVLRGPNSVPWGSQAIGGVVNITTARLTDGLHARASVEGGSYGTVFATGGVSGGNDRVSGALSGGYLADDGVSAAAGGTERDGYKQYGGSGRLGVELAQGIGIDLAGYYAHSRVDLDGYAPPTYAFGDDAEYSKAQEAYGYAGVHADLAGGDFRNRAAFTLADINRDNYASAAATAPTYRYRGRTERYEYQGDLRPVSWARVVLGAERENSRYYDGVLRAKTGISSGYGELIVTPAAPLTVTGGVRYDDHDQFGGHTSFGADAAYTLARGTTIRASYGEGFKAPTLYQLYSAYGTRSLAPEQARNYDVGVAQTFLGGHGEVSATYFNRVTRNQIDFRSCAAALVTNAASVCYQRPYGTYDNIDRATAEGVEIGVRLKPVAAFTVEGEYSFIDSQNRSPGANFGRELARRPRQTASASADYRFAFGLSVGGTVQVVGDSFDDAANTVRLDGYELTGVRAELPIGDHLAIYGRVDNLFDERYQTVAGYGTLGRAAYGGVRLKLR